MEFSEWERLLSEQNLPQAVVAELIGYAKVLDANAVPVIFESRHLAKLFGRTSEYVYSVVNASAHHYRSFEIPKRRGGSRRIDSPLPDLLECQRWINNNILKKLPVHEATHGFRAGKSIVSNASAHLSQNHLLKMDLKDFFPSISSARVMSIFRNVGYSVELARSLTGFCTLGGVLPQGAATSPAISNLVARKLDLRLTNLSAAYGLTYTRYADDLCFSGAWIPIPFSEIVGDIVSDSGFTVNLEKTQLCRSKGRRIVTGLSVNGESLKIPRKYKRELRQEAHYVMRYGYLSHKSKQRIRSPFYLESLLGRLQYWLSIEPGNDFANRALDVVSRVKASFESD